jgi:DNA-binding LacI/PurR family transcriptional regulator
MECAVTAGQFSAATMRRVAREAGVSTMTVSRALRNHPYVATDTARRVLEAVVRLGYRPNPLVAALMVQLRQTRPVADVGTLAYVTAFSPPSAWRASPSLMRLHAGAAARAAELGFHMEEFAWHNAHAGRHPADILAARGIVGLLLAPVPLPPPTLDLRWEGFCAVAIAHSLPAPDVHRVSNHQFDTLQQAFRNLRMRGYRRIGLALPWSNDERVGHLWSGANAASQISIPSGERVAPFLPQRWTEAGFAAWLQRSRPEAVISPLSVVRERMVALGVRVPTHVAFASLDLNDPSAEAGMDQNQDLVGRAAVDVLPAC